MDSSQIMTWAGQIAAAIVTLVVGTLVPSVFAILRDERNRRAVLLVSRAGLIAASAAGKAMYDALEKARLPQSEGGKLITPAERKDIIRTGVDEGWRVVNMEAQGVIKRVLDIYGGEQKVRESIEVIVRKRLGEVSP